MFFLYNLLSKHISGTKPCRSNAVTCTWFSQTNMLHWIMANIKYINGGNFASNDNSNKRCE